MSEVPGPSAVAALDGLLKERQEERKKRKERRAERVILDGRLRLFLFGFDQSPNSPKARL